MANNKMLKGVVEFYDDFTRPIFTVSGVTTPTAGLTVSQCEGALGTGTNTFTRLAINGGACHMLGDTNEAADMVLSGPLTFQGNKTGLLTLQARIRVNTSIAAAAVFVGFQNIITTGQISFEDGSMVTDPNDGFGLLYEGEATTPFYYTVGVGNDVDDTQQIANNVDTLVIATWTTIKIEADCHSGQSSGTDTGVMRYRVWIDGKLMRTATATGSTDKQGWTTSHCRSTVVLAPVIARYGRGTAYSVDVCEFAVTANKGDAFD